VTIGDRQVRGARRGPAWPGGEQDERLRDLMTDSRIVPL